MAEDQAVLLTQEDQEALRYSAQNLGRLFTENTHRMSDYDKKRYLPAVREICETYLPVLKLYHAFCSEQEEKTAAAAAYCAEHFMEAVAAFVEERMTGKRMKDRVLMEQYRMVMAAFVIPCIGEMKPRGGQMLIDELIQRWRKSYPSYPFMQTDVTTLQNGFRMRAWF